MLRPTRIGFQSSGGQHVALVGDIPKARAAYEVYFDIWHGADPDIPILKRAKAEYAKLP